MERHFTATAVIHDESGEQVLLIYHKKLDCWLCPGGHIDQNELPDDAVLREIYEETGLQAAFIDQRSAWLTPDSHAISLVQPFCILQERIPNKDQTTFHEHIDLVYRCIVSGKPVLNETECLDIRFFAREEINLLQLYDNVRSVIMKSFSLLDAK